MKKILSGSSFESLLTEEERKTLSEEESEILTMFEGLFDTFFEQESQKVLYTLVEPKENFTRHWFINAKTKMMESFPKTLQVEIIEEYDEDSYLCFSGACDIIVKKNLIKEKVEY